MKNNFLKWFLLAETAMWSILFVSVAVLAPPSKIVIFLGADVSQGWAWIVYLIVLAVLLIITTWFWSMYVKLFV
jgi:hypothetical protein